MKKQPKIAVYMSCYNHEKYVGQAIECIINQTYSNWELFIVNDASTDNSGKIIASFLDERIHFFDFKKNTKMVGAVNFMLELIKDGDFDYVHSMASDDYIDEDKFRRQIEFLEENPQYKACFTWDKVVFDNGLPYCEEYSHKDNQSRFDWMAYFIKYQNCMNANSALIDRDVFYSLGGINEYYIQTGDFKLWFEIVAKYPIYIMKEELTYYRRHETNLSNITLDRLIRTVNEQLRYFVDIIFPMDKVEFYRAFYKFLPYANINSDSELWAAKFYLFASLGMYRLDSIAIDILYTHSSNNEFIGILEEKYFFGTDEFYDYSGNAGVGWILDELCKLNIEKKPKPIIPLSGLLLEYIDRGMLNEYSMGELSYSTLRDLCEFALQYAGGSTQFEKIKEVIRKVRSNVWTGREEKNCLIIIGDKSRWQPTEEFLKKCNASNYYITYVNKQEESMIGKRVDIENKKILANCKYIDLFDYQNVCLNFANTQICNLQTIYYVDCITSDYECMKLLDGYPLECAQQVIISKELYEKNKDHLSIATMVMESISLY